MTETPPPYQAIGDAGKVTLRYSEGDTFTVRGHAALLVRWIADQAAAIDLGDARACVLMHGAVLPLTNRTAAIVGVLVSHSAQLDRIPVGRLEVQLTPRKVRIGVRVGAWVDLGEVEFVP